MPINVPSWVSYLQNSPSVLISMERVTGPEIIAPEEQWAWGELLAALSFLYRILKFVAVIPDTEVSDYHHPSSPSHPEWAIHDAKKARCR